MVETLSQLFLNTVTAYPKPDILLSKEKGSYVSISTEECRRRVKYIALGLRSLGCKAGDKIVILADNGPHWIMADFANLCLGAVTVPIYPSLVPEQIRYIIDDSDASIVLCSSPALWRKIEAVKKDLGKVSHFVFFPTEAPAGTLALSDLMAAGRTMDEKNPGLFEKIAAGVKPGDLASIIYTSGTAGGKNIAPQFIENLLKRSPYIANAVVVGGRRKFISAMIVPNLEKLEEYAKLNAIAYSGALELVGREEIKKFLQDEIDRITPNLAPYEKIKKIIVLDRDFEIEREELTPTLKIKRNKVEEKYKDLIDALYRE